MMLKRLEAAGRVGPNFGTATLVCTSIRMFLREDRRAELDGAVDNSN